MSCLCGGFVSLTCRLGFLSLLLFLLYCLLFPLSWGNVSATLYRVHCIHTKKGEYPTQKETQTLVVSSFFRFAAKTVYNQ